jgi:hypothetical protein
MPTGLDEYATDPVEWSRVEDLTDETYRLQQLTVYDADEIEAEYPQYGSWMRVVRTRDELEMWIETPRSLGRSIDEAGLGSGDVLDVVEVAKDDDGRWHVSIDADTASQSRLTGA